MRDYHLWTEDDDVSIGKGWPSHFSSNFFLVQLLRLPQPALAVREALSVRLSSTATSLRTSVPKNKRFFPFSAQCLGVFWQIRKELICSPAPAAYSWEYSSFALISTAGSPALI